MMALLLQLLHLWTVLPQESTERIGGAWLGIVIPAVLLLLSFGVTWMLYKHFSQQV